jgi:hypothetical protein
VSPLTGDERAHQAIVALAVDLIEAEPWPGNWHTFAAQAAIKIADAAQREMKSELADVRTYLEDARAGLDGPMEGGTPPDWSLAELAEAVGTSAWLTRTSRDEARAALRAHRYALQGIAAARSMATCSHYTSGGACSGSCRDEPRCMTCEPSGGWDAAIDEALAILDEEEFLLEGVERTHVLVPVAALSLLTGAVAMAHGVERKALADFTADAQLPEDGGELAARSVYINRLAVLRDALDAAASGVRAEWPS